MSTPNLISKQDLQHKELLLKVELERTTQEISLVNQAEALDTLMHHLQDYPELSFQKLKVYMLAPGDEVWGKFISHPAWIGEFGLHYCTHRAAMLRGPEQKLSVPFIVLSVPSFGDKIIFQLAMEYDLETQQNELCDVVVNLCRGRIDEIKAQRLQLAHKEFA